MVLRAPAEIDLQREAALIALDVGEPDLVEMKSGVPHQRAVAIDPEIVSRPVIAEHREPRRLDHFIRQPPVHRPSRGAGTLLPHRKHLRCQPQQRFFRMRHPGPKLGQMNECVRGQADMPLWWRDNSPQSAIVGRPAPTLKTNRCAPLACYSVMARPGFLGCNEVYPTTPSGKLPPDIEGHPMRDQ